MALIFSSTIDVAALQSTWIANCCTAAAFALVVYDHFCTLPQEVALIWGRNLNSVIVLFHLNRFLILAWAFISVAIEFSPLASVTSCIGVEDLYSVVILLLYILWAAFSAIRVYAVGGGSWLLSLIVALLDLVPVVMNAYSFFATYWYEVTFIPGYGEACNSGSNSSPSAIIKYAKTVATRVCVIAADLVVLLITWRRTYSIKRDSPQPGVSAVLLRDGTAYFLALLSLNLLNIVGNVTNFFSLASSFFIPLSSIIITRFFLNLRQSAYSTQGSADSGASQFSFICADDSQLPTPRSDVKLSNFVGPMGEILDHRSVESIRLIDTELEWEFDMEEYGSAV